MKRNKIVLVIIYIILFSICSGCTNNNYKKNPQIRVNNPTPIDLYRYNVACQINDNWKFERKSDPDKSHITSIVFKIMPDGKITDIIFVKRSGNIELDESALDAIKMTSPTKPFPGNIDKPYIEMGLRFAPFGVK